MKSKISSYSESFLLPNRKKSSCSVIFVTLVHFSLTIFLNISQNCCTMSHLQNRCRMFLGSHYRRYIYHFLWFSLFLTLCLFARIMWTKPTWNHFNFTLCIFVVVDFVKCGTAIHIFWQQDVPFVAAPWLASIFN